MSDSRILIVDDEERTRTFICDGLSALGITNDAICVSSAEEALAEAERSHVDLVISDVRMPGLNGLDLVRFLHQLHPGTPIILITGYSTRDLERAAIGLAVHTMLKKPFGLEALAAAVKDALRRTQPAPSVIMPPSALEPIIRQMNLLKRDTGAQWIGLLTAGGEVAVSVGQIDHLDSVLEHLGQNGWAPHMTSICEECACFLYVQSQPHDIYVTSVDREHCLALVYDRRWQGSRIGAVWLGARHAVQELARVLNVPPQLAAPQALALPQVANGVPGIEP